LPPIQGPLLRGAALSLQPVRRAGARQGAEIASFCSFTYDVTVPVFAKVDVNGAAAAPLWKHLKHAAPGLLGSEAVKWNFMKFLVDRSGAVVARFAPTTKPEEIDAEIEKLL